MLLLQVQSTLSKLSDFRDFRYADIENAYQTVKLSTYPVYVIAITVAMLFAIFNIFKTAQDSMAEGQELDFGKFVKVLREKWRFLLIIALMPVATSAIEASMGMVQDYYITDIGEPNASIYDAMKKQVLLLAEKENNSSIWDINVGEFIMDAIDYTVVLSLQPFIIFYIEASYSAALVYRFFYLAAVELMGMLAVASLLHDRTKLFFFNWVKSLVICYLMIPIFLFANMFTDAIYETMLLSATYNWIFPMLILVAGIKTTLFVAAPLILHRVF